MISKDTCIEGQLLLIDKPYKWTSFQVVNKIRWGIRKAFDIKKIKVGHAGTLDPLATGLMIVCTGKMTKQIAHFMGMEKTYTGTFRLGATTPSYDLETPLSEIKPFNTVTAEELDNVRVSFLGNILQKPPMHSAIKVDGQRLYTLARAGKQMDVSPREVSIKTFDFTQIQLPDIDFSVRCSKGTYIRSLAHDVGQSLGCGAHLTALRRTAIGDYDVSASLSLESFLRNLDEKS